MKIVLIAPLHSYPLEKSRSELSPNQAQFYWAKSLRKLGAKVNVIYTSDFFPSYKFNALINNSGFLRNVILKLLRRTPIQIIYNLLVAKASNDLKDIVSFNPDAVLISGGPWLNAYPKAFFEQLHNTFQIILFNGTSPSFSPHSVELELSPFVDLLILNSQIHIKEWEEKGYRNAKCLPISAIDPDIFQTKEKEFKDRKFELTFIGSLYHGRFKIIEKLIASGIRIHCWGQILEDIPPSSSFWSCYEGPADYLQMVKILKNSKISLNLHLDSMSTGGNLRTFEIPAAGAVQVVDFCPPEWFSDCEIVRFNGNETTLIRILKELLNDEEKLKMLSMNGQKRTFKDHSFDNRMTTILNHIERNNSL